VQVAVPLVLLHTVPHAPQLAVFVLVLISQPLAAELSQLAKPALHAIWQVPALHVAVPLVVEHLVLHALQLLMSVFRLTSQPLAALPSQSA
jgi:hypothetical protein